MGLLSWIATLLFCSKGGAVASSTLSVSSRGAITINMTKITKQTSMSGVRLISASAKLCVRLALMESPLAYIGVQQRRAGDEKNLPCRQISERPLPSNNYKLSMQELAQAVRVRWFLEPLLSLPSLPDWHEQQHPSVIVRK